MSPKLQSGGSFSDRGRGRARGSPRIIPDPHARWKRLLRAHSQTAPSTDDRRPRIPGSTTTVINGVRTSIHRLPSDADLGSLFSWGPGRARGSPRIIHYPHARGKCLLRTYSQTVPSTTDRRPRIPRKTTTGINAVQTSIHRLPTDADLGSYFNWGPGRSRGSSRIIPDPHAGDKCPLRTYRQTVPSTAGRRPRVPGNTSTGKRPPLRVHRPRRDPAEYDHVPETPPSRCPQTRSWESPRLRLKRLRYTHARAPTSKRCLAKDPRFHLFPEVRPAGLRHLAPHEPPDRPVRVLVRLHEERRFIVGYFLDSHPSDQRDCDSPGSSQTSLQSHEFWGANGLPPLPKQVYFWEDRT